MVLFKISSYLARLKVGRNVVFSSTKLVVVKAASAVVLIIALIQVLVERIRALKGFVSEQVFLDLISAEVDQIVLFQVHLAIPLKLTCILAKVGNERKTVLRLQCSGF